MLGGRLTNHGLSHTQELVCLCPFHLSCVSSYSHMVPMPKGTKG